MAADRYQSRLYQLPSDQYLQLDSARRTNRLGAYSHQHDRSSDRQRSERWILPDPEDDEPAFAVRWRAVVCRRQTYDQMGCVQHQLSEHRVLDQQWSDMERDRQWRACIHGLARVGSARYADHTGACQDLQPRAAGSA